MDPISLIVTALVSGAAAGVGEGAVKDAYAALRNRLQELFAGDRLAEATLEGHTADPNAWEKPLRQQLERFRADRDPEATAAAQQVLQVVDLRRSDARTYHVTSSGRASVGDRAEVQHAQAGRDIRIDKSRRRTTFVLGGGVLVALVLLAIWAQYSRQQARANELSAYQQAVLATCERIQKTATSSSPPTQVTDEGPVIRRAELLRELDRQKAARDEQLNSLLAQEFPARLQLEHAAVVHAKENLDAAYPASLDVVRGWPPTLIYPEEYLTLSRDPAMSGGNDAYRRLGDALTRLAGSACSIEP